MKQTIQLRFSQQLTMTPQLQQAIRLLQLSAIELQQEVQDALESNVMLETEDEARLREETNAIDLSPDDFVTEREASIVDVRENHGEDREGQEDRKEKEYEESDGWLEAESINLKNTDLATEWPVDSDWSDHYDSYALNLNNSSTQQNVYDGDILAQKSRTETLRDHLNWQLNLTLFSDRDRVIAITIIDAINDDGYLTYSIEDILNSIDDAELELDEILAVLHRLQAFDPPGIAARNLQECLLLQLKQLPKNDPSCQRALKICQNYFNLLGEHNYTAIKNALNISDTELKSALHLLRTMHPYPGLKISTTAPQYVIPDVFVIRRQGSWHVELNQDITPRLRVNPDYAKLIKRSDRSVDNTCLKSHLQEARCFLRNLAGRNETLLRVAMKIVELQRGFFEYGPEAMRPLVLRDVAEALGMHESTVSRITAQKYLRSPRGTFELKFFFPSHVSTDSGGQCSATAIRALIKKLIASEQPKSPLSDEALAKCLAEQGIKVARRTVAKYRESMGIQPSAVRKRLL